ncbi:MAG: mechanosensitive ion channel [Bacteroidetes bacterium]|nr:mechanosensitive ion channel [Bacteroidota bacterium]HET6245652.1 mechanosensitive ion channel domain-containing protein [Bacteroidia bacterium]
MKQWFKDLEEILRPALGYKLFQLGDTPFTLGTIFYLILSLFLLFYISEKLRVLLTRRILVKYNIILGVRQSIATIVKYTIVVIGLMVIVESTGFNLSTLGLIAGALGVGIGFGLQGITNNFISGIIILFERPVKVGDRVDVGEVTGIIIKIAARATTVISNDNIAIVVPNSEFINAKVINWTLNDRNVRFNFPVGVAYTEDPERIKKILLDVVDENPGVQKVPKPDVLFDSFGESSLNFILRVWTSSYSDNPNVLKSQLYYSIFEKFKEHKIRIPYPQRDLHLISGFDKPEEQPLQDKKD